MKIHTVNSYLASMACEQGERVELHRGCVTMTLLPEAHAERLRWMKNSR